MSAKSGRSDESDPLLDADVDERRAGSASRSVDGDASSERAIRCPRCGGRFERRTPRGNPFLVKKGAMVVCVDCGMDCAALKVYRIDEPW